MANGWWHDGGQRLAVAEEAPVGDGRALEASAGAARASWLADDRVDGSAAAAADGLERFDAETRAVARYLGALAAEQPVLPQLQTAWYRHG